MGRRRYVGFVRAVMIGRDDLHREVLEDILDRADTHDGASHMTTGNISFGVEPGALDTTVERIQHDIESVVGRPTPVFVRTLDQLTELVERDPFAAMPHPDPRARLVTMVRDQVPADFDAPILSPNGDYHVFAVHDGEIFSITIDTGGRVQDPGGLIERRIGEPVTTRAWGTITKIVAKLS